MRLDRGGKGNHVEHCFLHPLRIMNLEVSVGKLLLDTRGCQKVDFHIQLLVCFSEEMVGTAWGLARESCFKMFHLIASLPRS